MKSYSLALAQAKQFAIDGRENVRIAKAKRKNSYKILLGDRQTTSNYEVIATVSKDDTGVCIDELHSVSSPYQIKKERKGLWES